MICDSDYIRYVESGESAAVFITRDLVQSIDTKGMWVDVMSFHGEKNEFSQWDIQGFSVELFPRKKRPVYPANASEMDKKYITWKTAHEDISNQRSKGKRGPRFYIKPTLVNRNRGKYKTIEKCWNRTFERYVPKAWKNSSCEMRRVRVPEKPKWEYDILSVERL